MILILEDDADRVRRFQGALARIAPLIPSRVWRDAHAMIRELDEHLPSAALISLDHDLAAPPNHDPGDGLDVVRFLVSRPMVRPVIVHSSNGERSRIMLGELELARWPSVRVAPFGDSWIEDDWSATVAGLIRT